MKVYYATKCPTCCRNPFAPFRVYDSAGRAVEGCVDHFHTGHIVTPSESATWHARPAAKRIRQASKLMRHGGVTEYAP
jgi:hypothetical protein